MTTSSQQSDLQRFLAKSPRVAEHPEIAVALEGIASLREAQQHVHSLFWQYHDDLDLLWTYGEFLYLSGYATHPDHNLGSLVICTDNETTRTVKRLAFEQWQAYHPEGYPGRVWLHYASEQEEQTMRQLWQVSVYRRYENALTHDISNRLAICDETGRYWDHSRCRWYREHTPYSIAYSTSMIAEHPDGRLQVIKNMTCDWEKKELPMRHYPVLPHAPASITEQMRPGKPRRG